MPSGVIVKKSKINKKGVFAAKDFKKGETVIVWKPKMISGAEAENASAAHKHFIVKDGKKYLLMRSPERFVNHSCDANTRVRGQADVAIRTIKKGEEITSNYGAEECLIPFTCRCGQPKCRGLIGKNE